MDKISEHITYDEATRSATAIRNGIKNAPDSHQLANMRNVAEACFEPLRRWYKKALRINSFFRCYELNTKIGGSKTSQHMQGKAIDVDAGSRAENKKLFEWIKANLKFDQLIWEFGDDEGPEWVHVSFDLGANRNQVLHIK